MRTVFDRFFKFLAVLCLAIALTLAHPANADPETPTADSGETHVCDMQPQQIESAASQASGELKQLQTALSKFHESTKQLDSNIFGANGDCSHVKGWMNATQNAVNAWNSSSGIIEGFENAGAALLNAASNAGIEWMTKKFSWTAKDAAGAERDPKPQENQLKSLMSGIDFSGTEYNIPVYVEENKKLLLSAKQNLEKGQREGNVKAVNAYTKEVNKYNQCAVTLQNMLSSRNEVKRHYENAHEFLAGLSGQDVVCQCAADGTVKNCDVTDDEHVEEDVDSLKCKTLPEYMAIFGVCITCPIFEKVLIADQKLAEHAFSKLAEGLIGLLGIGFMIYLAIHTLNSVSSPQSVTLSKYLTDLSIQGFKVLVAVELLLNSSFVYQTLLSPIIQGGLDLGMTITGGTQNQIKAHGEAFSNFADSNLLSASMMKSIMGTVKGFSEQASKMPAVGWALMCRGSTDLQYMFLPHFFMIIEGAIVLIFGVMVALSIGFYLLDVSIELGILCCIIPLLIACWPFKLTSSYTKIGWQMILHTCFNFIMMGVIITVITTLTTESLTSGISGGDFEALINGGSIDELEEKMRLGGLAILLVIICACISLKIVNDVENITNKLAQGAGFTMSPQLAAQAVQMGQAAFKTVTDFAVKIIGIIIPLSDELLIKPIMGALDMGVNKVNEMVNHSSDVARKAAGTGKNAKNAGARKGDNTGQSF